MSGMPEGKAQLQDSEVPVLTCDGEPDDESSGRRPGHESQGKGSMELGVWVLSCISLLYIPGYKALTKYVICKFFFHSIGCHFILLMASFTMQKVLSLMWSHWFIFAVLAFAFDD